MSDYGNPDDPNDFDFIRPISPLHNVSSTKVLPPYMLCTADRTFPASQASETWR
jgi:prolyl oligopeptidase